MTVNTRMLAKRWDLVIISLLTQEKKGWFANGQSRPQNLNMQVVGVVQGLITKDKWTSLMQNDMKLGFLRWTWQFHPMKVTNVSMLNERITANTRSTWNNKWTRADRMHARDQRWWRSEQSWWQWQHKQHWPSSTLGTDLQTVDWAFRYNRNILLAHHEGTRSWSSSSSQKKKTRRGFWVFSF